MIDELAAQLEDRQAGVTKEMIKAGLIREFQEHDNLSDKSIRELTPDELAERGREIAQRRGTQVRSAKALPMPSLEQVNAMVEQKNTISEQTANPGFAKLLEAVKKMPIKQ
jgi:hypothetical protein